MLYGTDVDSAVHKSGRGEAFLTKLAFGQLLVFGADLSDIHHSFFAEHVKAIADDAWGCEEILLEFLLPELGSIGGFAAR